MSKIEEIYKKVNTPYKFGAVVKFDGLKVDSPVVFKHCGKYYMSFIGIDSDCKGGYNTFIAESDDLIHWANINKIMGKANDWDMEQCGGYAQFIENEFGGSNEINKINGDYIFAYVGGNLKGYETDPLSMGEASTEDFTNNNKFIRKEIPILSGRDIDAKKGENLTIFKADMFKNKNRKLGYKYVCAYNARGQSKRESIFLAVSNDAKNWQRFGNKPIIDVENCSKETLINGDPQIVLINGLYVMFYFVLDEKGAYNTFAISENLIDWEKWKGKPLMKNEEEWENVYAHKQWIIEEKGIVYQYYCAVNSKGERFIALATNKKLNSEEYKK